MIKITFSQEATIEILQYEQVKFMQGIPYLFFMETKMAPVANEEILNILQ